MAIKLGRPLERSRVAPGPGFGSPPLLKDRAEPAAERLDLAIRLPRNRRAEWARRMVREHTLTTDDLIWPLFIVDGAKKRVPVDSMPGVERLSVDEAVRAAVRAAELTIPCLALFPYTDPGVRDADGSEALNPDNLVCRAIRAIKKEVPNIGVLCDVALDPYTSHGHDGLLSNGTILNDETVAVLVKQALVQAEAGCDIIAPSDMMDGRVGAIRTGLDSANCSDVQIMAYAAKYASVFYGPFRDAVGSSATLTGATAEVARMTRSGPARPSRRWCSPARAATPSVRVRRSPATSGPIRWTRPIRMKRCAKSSSISPRAPTW